MKLFVAGATGRVGREVVDRLAERGHQVTAGARKPERITESDQVKPVLLDLENTADLENLVKGHDAVIFTAGSRGKNLLQVDAFGAVRLMRAAEKTGIKRFIQLSSIFALEPERWTGPSMEALLDFNIAKFFADSYLIGNTQLDYTILQPGSLVEGEATGLISTEIQQPNSNLLTNVAETLAVIVETPETIGKVIKMSDGDLPIKEALLAAK